MPMPQLTKRQWSTHHPGIRKQHCPQRTAAQSAQRAPCSAQAVARQHTAREHHLRVAVMQPHLAYPCRRAAPQSQQCSLVRQRSPPCLAYTTHRKVLAARLQTSGKRTFIDEPTPKSPATRRMRQPVGVSVALTLGFHDQNYTVGSYPRRFPSENELPT